MVVEVTGHNAHYVLWKMPLAQALHYQLVYLEMKGMSAKKIHNPIKASILSQLKK
jgi:hypothetical protein